MRDKPNETEISGESEFYVSLSSEISIYSRLALQDVVNDSLQTGLFSVFKVLIIFAVSFYSESYFEST